MTCNTRTVLGARILLACLVSLTFATELLFSTTFIDRFQPSDLRVISYNVFFDANFSANSQTDLDTPQRFARVVQALRPDILNLQEIYSHSAQEVADLMNAIAPLHDGEQWYTHRSSDNVIVSRFPFLTQGGQSAWAEGLIDLPDDGYSNDLYIINDHFACCNNEPSRQASASLMIKHLEDLRTSGGAADLPENTPILVLGDLNIVGSGRPLETLLTGNILNEERFGSDSPPDWDGTSLANSLPSHNGVGADNYTWRDDSDIFDPNILDFVLYTDSVLKTANNFVLNTTSMSSEELAETGLQIHDIMIRADAGFYDHLPVVVDFRLREIPEPSTLMLLIIGLSLGFQRKARLVRSRFK